MCGIAGILAHDTLSPDDARERLRRMRDVQHHRGPDDGGIAWSERLHAGLAASRLAIRDLSPAGHMPMAIDDVSITYNGEIYNAEPLRAELIARRHNFNSHSDTEVILRGYLEWGESVVERLRGMFAFGILDERNQQLFLARDPLGIKPLYYTRTGPFMFASELRALISGGRVDAAIADTALSAYLQLGSIPAPLTIYAHIAALTPGHTANVPLRNPREVRLRRYWSLADTQARTTNVADVEAALSDAIRSHLVSDAPIGAFLSGGLDSSTVVAIASQHTSERLRTCSIAFESATHDESGYARAVSAAFGTNHYERVVTRAEFITALPAFFNAIDQPTIDGYNTYFVSQTARQAGLSVALSGLGGDELFGGYPSFTGVPRLMRVLKLARAGGDVAGRAITFATRTDRWRKVAAATQRAVTPASAYLVYRGLFTRTEAESLLPDAEHFDAESYVAQRAGAPDDSLKEWVGRAELGTYTAAQLLRDSDAASMAHSLELRVPLLDTRLVETVQALPAQQRFPGKRNKELLRRLMSDRLPPAVLERRDRQGFSFPMQEWLSEPDETQNWHAPLVQRLDARALGDVRKRFRAGQTHWSRVWSLTVLDHWSRELPIHA